MSSSLLPIIEKAGISPWTLEGFQLTLLKTNEVMRYTNSSTDTVAREIFSFFRVLILFCFVTQCPFLGIFVQKLFFIEKPVDLSSKSSSALTKHMF